MLATVSEAGVVLWNARTGKEVDHFRGDSHSHLAFSADGRRLFANHAGVLFGWDLTVTAEQRQEREVLEFVETRFARHLLREEVLADLPCGRNDLSAPQRQAALALARTYSESPEDLVRASWKVSEAPFASQERRELALRWAEAAARIDPGNPRHQAALGAAHYRLGGYEKARAALLEAERLSDRDSPDVLALLALTCHKLGKTDEAREWLTLLHEADKLFPYPEVHPLSKEARAAVGGH
jgi:tetratricopeptide (TPR) repeat protein